MRGHAITGGGGIQLHLAETGYPNGRPILFIHGFSQSGLAWSWQMQSVLAKDYRLLAIDLRGHGRSDKPREGYADTRLWADDINAAIRTLNLAHPILTGWSYGPLVILDYIRHYGEEALGGIHFVGGITKLGSDEAMAVISPQFLGLVPGFFSTEVEESVRSLDALVRMCFTREQPDEELYLMLGYNLSVPPHVRQALLSRSVDNDDLLRQIRKPVLITHGTADAVISPSAAEQHKACMPHAEIHMVENAGHAPFRDEATTFNRQLQTFAESL